ncbi:MAG: adenylate/guanylate cyclase domain-containing protein [Deltaproteobacteria bacterium]|nr:adenylate/guanylate cyclase domain-containing protein [Deltaproteobacteria bacterium]
MGSMFLQEAEATVVMFDLRGFATLAARLGPVDLGASLSRFYEHAEACIVANEGRIIRFMGDWVLAAWLASEVGDHRKKSLAAVAESRRRRAPWVQKGVDGGHPLLDYSVAAATGPVLVGQIGTERLKFFDVLGEPASIVRKLTVVCTLRNVEHLVTSETLDFADKPAAVEVEGVELGGKMLRLFRLE